MLNTKQPTLRNFWYATVPLDHLADGPKPFKLLGQEIVLFLDREGVPAALEDRCCHRTAKLSKGWIRDGDIVCGYHGWQYDRDGRLVMIPQFPFEQTVPNAKAKNFHAKERYGYVWVCLGEPLTDVPALEYETDPAFRRIHQFYDRWQTSSLRLMENSFDNAHFAFVHKGTFGDINQPKPEKYEITETDYGFVAETIVTVRNPPNAARITGASEPTTKRIMRNHWFLPFCRTMDMLYPSGLRHVIFNCATPIDDGAIQLVQILYRNDREEDCPTPELIAWDKAIIEEDREMLEATDPDAIVDMSRKIEMHMPSDRPGMLMRNRLLALLQSHGEAEATSMSDGRIAALIDDLGEVPFSVEPSVLRRRSRDYFWYSQALAEDLAGKLADVIVTPRNEADVLRVAAVCARRRVPLTPRGAGTGNYGQAVPLQGGVVLDMSEMDDLEWARPGVMRTQPGARMHVVDDWLKLGGQEQRLHPSTKRSATIGGFVAGGSGGVGSVTWGGLREPGNVLAARVITLEETPRAIELRGDAAQKVNRAYGTTGIITALEMPLAPLNEWIDVAVAYDSFAAACEAGLAAALADGLVKKLLTPISWPIPRYFGPFAAACPEGSSLLLAMIAKPSLETFKSLIGAGEIVHEKPFDESPAETPLYEYSWNHTTLQVLKSDRNFSYQQCLFPHDRLLESVAEMVDLFGDEVWHHLEFIRFGGRVTASALPVVRFTSRERLFEIVELYEKHGVFVANPHVFTLEDGSRHKRAEADQIGFKAQVDPYGLLNPGKMRSYVPSRA